MFDEARGIFEQLPAVPERTLAPGQAVCDLLTAERPFVLRGLVREWPLVQAGLTSPHQARQYLLQHDGKQPFEVTIGSPASSGRIFYRDDMLMNVQMIRARLPEVFERIEKHENDDNQPIIYLSSVDTRTFFRGLHEANNVAIGRPHYMERIWIGMRTRIAAHNDFPANLACVAVGRRRFTVFPPEQFRNLYIGPLDNTPAGRAVSMVDFLNPDFDKHPRFREAMRHGQVAELGPGDAIYMPSMWWHHVEGLERFNILVNYWWRDTPRYLGQPQDALNHAIMSIRDLPDAEKKIWRDMFDYYVFGDGAEVTAHIPRVEDSILGRMTPEQANKIRAYLLKALNS
ncbi:MAG TPA: cupin-like domain-containing protein [Caulobacterales bacterium]|nr:cupin-like domain-containing protein [Caulobacterales bacterium]